MQGTQATQARMCQARQTRSTHSALRTLLFAGEYCIINQLPTENISHYACCARAEINSRSQPRPNLKLHTGQIFSRRRFLE
ncbi:uncharacterized protein CIMG_13095 [Coccidioides immitis RS]|uniref:Uncharacterized protein n=1 Tax=Coccidioides immitis (strain RS) TaxID=246410 RepID=A0A0D8JU58_COCIM|nr:uncharacterized protein CIMG_13095 [Coccidioides immitis RS]KJF60644.1 hypothetical protein CIMG_13095 [Coccidioides immitis RS]